MKHVIKGNLLGYLCDECLENLNNTKVRLYIPSGKDVFKLLTDAEIEKKENYLIGEGVTDELGNYEIELNERYQDGEVEFNFVVETVPNSLHAANKFPTKQFYATKFQPDWEYNDNQDANASFSFAITAKWWCFIRGTLFDAWVICGRLLNCQTGNAISGATITAMDADLLTDDTLGTAITSGTGHFRIDYTSATFKQTFLSPWINVETDPGLPIRFQSGPDVYFKAELAGTMLLDETKKNARKNVGYCLCVNLCSEINVVDPDDPTFPSAWSGVGDVFSASFGTNPYDFDVDGFAGSGKYALYSKVRLTGQAALKSASGNPIEYRFVISDVTTPNGGPSPADADFTKVIGVTPGLFASSLVLKLTRKVAAPSNNEIFVYSKQADFDANGWFDANKAIDRTLIEKGLTPADLSLYNIIDDDTLLTLNTNGLTTAPNVPSTVAPGQTIPAANKIPVEKFAIRFEIREVVNKATNQFNVVSGSGKTLNSVVMNNNSIYMKLSITELEATTLCTPINGTVHAKYTVYHPYLTYTTLGLRSNSNSVNRLINDFDNDGVLPTGPNHIPASDELVSAGTVLNRTATADDMTRCTYTLKLKARSRLHNGDNPISTQGPIEQYFFYDV
ncbi:conserved protein of unknown function [Tenacibaculum sp. 190524A02b]|uniref:Uncharacterized protein n=1 Tax=Tenacibaculum vairaonense TaxID=3137860 RepID=A0ABM9PHK5_9FLAO